MSIKNLPYLPKLIITRIETYNPDYGDERICKCGHPYYRHFDTYDKMKAVGCKYCYDCEGFEERENEVRPLPRE